MYVGESENNNQSKWLSFGITEHSGHTLLNQKVVPKNESEQDMTVVEVYQDWWEKRSLRWQNCCPLLPTAMVFAVYPLSILSVHGFSRFGISWHNRANQNSPLFAYFEKLRALWAADRLPLLDASAASASDLDGEEPVSLFEGEMFEELAGFVRRFVSSEDEHDPETADIRAAAEHFVRWLNQLRECHSTCEMVRFAWQALSKDGVKRGGCWRNDANSHGRYSSAYLLNALRVYMSTRIRQNHDTDEYKHLKGLMMRMVGLFPANYQASLRDEVERMPVPARRRLERGRLHADVAMMLYYRDKHAQMVADNHVLYPLADSSQLRFGNVMMAEYYSIKGGADLLQAAAAAMELKRLPRADPFPPDTLGISEVNKRIIENASGHHVMPCAFLGQRRSQLPHKLHSLIHAYRLESHHWKLCRDLLALGFCWCTDTGTEKKFRRCKVQPIKYFDWWGDKDTIEPSEEDNGLSLDFVDDGKPDAAPPAAPLPDDNGPVTIDLTRALGIRGTMHMVNKLQVMVLAALTSWPETKEFIKAICLYLNNNDTRK